MTPFSIRNIEKRFENETPEERNQRCADNRRRTLETVQRWKEFAEKYPELAENMVCKAA